MKGPVTNVAHLTDETRRHVEYLFLIQVISRLTPEARE